MAVGDQLALIREVFQHLALETGGIPFDHLEDLRFEDHEPAVDPPLSHLRFLREPHQVLTVEHHLAEPRGGMHRGDRGEPPMRSVERQQLAALGDVRTPSIADVFVAVMSNQPGQAQGVTR